MNEGISSFTFTPEYEINSYINYFLKIYRKAPKHNEKSNEKEEIKTSYLSKALIKEKELPWANPNLSTMMYLVDKDLKTEGIQSMYSTDDERIRIKI